MQAHLHVHLLCQLYLPRLLAATIVGPSRGVIDPAVLLVVAHGWVSSLSSHACRGYRAVLDMG